MKSLVIMRMGTAERGLGYEALCEREHASNSASWAGGRQRQLALMLFCRFAFHFSELASAFLHRFARVLPRAYLAFYHPARDTAVSLLAFAGPKELSGS